MTSMRLATKIGERVLQHGRSALLCNAATLSVDITLFFGQGARSFNP